jgi:GNAT superfamily N-acetyltransferase
VHPPEDHRRWVGGALLADHEVWVACTVEDGDSVVAVLALSPGWVDQLYVAPAWMGQGVGAQLLDLAKQRHPGGLQLWTFVSNLGAQRFYERHGFVVAEQTDGSGNEEHAPDLRYVWRPSVGSAGG